MSSEGWSMALLPGFPRPQTSGAHFEALVASVRHQGQTRPILIDREGVVWEGRTLLNVLLLLGIDPVFQVVDDGLAATVSGLAQRELNVLEVTQFIGGLAMDDGCPTQLGAGKKSERIAEWLRKNLGWTRGFSPRNIEHYREVSRVIDMAPARLIEQVAKATSLNQARQILGLIPPRELSRPAREETSASSPEDAVNCLLEQLSNTHEYSADLIGQLNTLIVVVQAVIENHSQPAQICAHSPMSMP